MVKLKESCVPKYCKGMAMDEFCFYYFNNAHTEVMTEVVNRFLDERKKHEDTQTSS